MRTIKKNSLQVLEINVSISMLLFFSISSCNTTLPKGKVNQATLNLSEIAQIEAKRQSINYTDKDVVTSGIVDNKGQLWFGTSQHGVYRYDGASFTNFREKDGLCHNAVWSVLEDKDGLLWFGTSDGLCIYDGKKFTHLPIPDNGRQGATFVLNLFEDKEGNIWFGTWGNGAYRYDGKNFTSFLKDAGRIHNGLYNNVIRSILQDREDNIWIASLSHGGITRYDGKTFTNYTEQDGLCDDMVFASFEDSKGNIWLGGNEDGDLCRYDGKSFIHYTASDGVCNNFVSCFHEDTQGNLWIGSETENSLCIFDGESFAAFSVEGADQLPATRFIIEDTKGNIWIGGRIGSLWCYDGTTLKDYTQTKNQ